MTQPRGCYFVRHISLSSSFVITHRRRATWLSARIFVYNRDLAPMLCVGAFFRHSAPRDADHPNQPITHPPMLNFLSSSASWRPNLVRNLTGDVLEIGAGTGENFGHYGPAAKVWAIEPDPVRAHMAQAEAQRIGASVQVDVAPAENLPYAAASFDHVVSSLVFCSVADQRVAFAEVARVLRPNGVLHMIEHVRPTNPLLGWIAAEITPPWSRFAHNCHLDRPTLAVLTELGWTVEVLKRRSVFVKLRATRTPKTNLG